MVIAPPVRAEVFRESTTLARPTAIRITGQYSQRKPTGTPKLSSRKSTPTATMANPKIRPPDRKSTRLNSSHLVISYAVFCLKKKSNFDDADAAIGELTFGAIRDKARECLHIHGCADLVTTLDLFFFNDTATTEIYTLSLHDALPI